jgi:hypothetical protein
MKTLDQIKVEIEMQREAWARMGMEAERIYLDKQSFETLFQGGHGLQWRSGNEERPRAYTYQGAPISVVHYHFLGHIAVLPRHPLR